MEFVVKYAKPSGEVLESVQIGQTEDEVRHHLQEQGMLPISVKTRGVSLFNKRERQKPINPDNFIVFNQQFVSLIKAGLPILRALDLLKAQIKNPILKRHIIDVRDRVHSGAMLSDALKAQMVFPTVYTASIYAGERSGDLAEVITRYTGYQKTVLAVKKRFLTSLIYPAFLVVLCIVMVTVILTYVIPQFAELYKGLGTELPRPTRILIYISTTLKANLIFILPVILGSALALKLWIGTAAGRLWLDRLKLKAPVVGHLWTMFSMAQLSRTIATLLTGGTPLLTTLQVVRDASDNSVIAEAIRTAVIDVQDGKPLSDSLEKTGHFPDLAVEMIRVGEQTGSLPDMLIHVADYYDEDVNNKSAALLSVVEPVILIFVAIFVALILISLYLPIFSLGSQMQK
jgi:type IV pilus assembly protein PilC